MIRINIDLNIEHYWSKYTTQPRKNKLFTSFDSRFSPRITANIGLAKLVWHPDPGIGEDESRIADPDFSLDFILLKEPDQVRK